MPPFDPELEFGTADDGQQSPEPRDPAVVAATIMLEWAMLVQAVSADELKRPGAVSMVSVPTGEWAKPASKAWTNLVSGPLDTKRAERFSRFDSPQPLTVTFQKAKAPDKYDRDRDAEAMWRGYCMVGFSPEPGWLPPDLVAAVDYRLHVNPLFVGGATQLAAN